MPNSTIEASVYLSPSEETLGIIKTIKNKINGVEMEIKREMHTQRECERDR